MSVLRARLHAIPAELSQTFAVPAGATLRVIDPEGGQLTDLVAYPAAPVSGEEPLFTVLGGAPAASVCLQPFPEAFATVARRQGARCCGFHLFEAGSTAVRGAVELRAERDLVVGLAPCRAGRRHRPGAIAYVVVPPAS